MCQDFADWWNLIVIEKQSYKSFSKTLDISENIINHDQLTKSFYVYCNIFRWNIYINGRIIPVVSLPKISK